MAACSGPDPGVDLIKAPSFLEEARGFGEMEDPVELVVLGFLPADAKFVAGEVEGGGFAQLGGFDFDITVGTVFVFGESNTCFSHFYQRNKICQIHQPMLLFWQICFM